MGNTPHLHLKNVGKIPHQFEAWNFLTRKCPLQNPPPPFLVCGWGYRWGICSIYWLSCWFAHLVLCVTSLCDLLAGFTFSHSWGLEGCTDSHGVPGHSVVWDVSRQVARGVSYAGMIPVLHVPHPLQGCANGAPRLSCFTTLCRIHTDEGNCPQPGASQRTPHTGGGGPLPNFGP